MVYIIELLKGVVFSIGFILGLLFATVYVLNKAQGDSRYYPDDLLEPFREYLEEIKKEEKYESISLVQSIISNLENNIVPKDISLFDIKKDMSVQMKDDQGTTALKVITKYIILGRNNELQ